MNHSFILLYVEDPAASAAFYGKLLGREPIQSSPTFVMFALDSGVMLGLWVRHDVEPAASGGPGGGEIAFAEPGAEAVRARCAIWRDSGVRIAQEPTAMDFGFTFVGLDPDGHRLRVFAPPA
jgi:catechol 2,3-dioxygenase-like lactoylglutathione lyase family enzyme